MAYKTVLKPNIKRDRARRAFRKAQGTFRTTYLAAVNGDIRGTRAGYLWVHDLAGADVNGNNTYGAVYQLRLKSGAAIQYRPNWKVKVATENGVELITGMDEVELERIGYDTLQTNFLDPSSRFKLIEDLQNLQSYPNGDATVQVNQTIYRKADGTYDYLSSQNIDILTGNVPSTDNQVVLCLWLETDGTISYTVSSEESIDTDLQSAAGVATAFTLINECAAAAPVGALGIWSYIIWDDTTATGIKNKFHDLRGMIGAGGGGSTSFTVAGDTGTPQTISDGNTFTIEGGDGIDTVAGATDKVTVAVNSTVIRTTGIQSIGAGLTVTAPTIADFTNAGHNHTNAAGGGQLTDAALSAAVGIAKGGTGQTTQTAAMDALSPTTTKGDLLVDNGTSVIRLPAGTDGQSLVADSTQAAGVKWGNSSIPQTILQGLTLRWLANDKILVSGGTISHGTTLINKTIGTVLTMGTAGDWIDGASGEAASLWAHVYINSSGTLKLHDTMPNNSSSVAATYIATMRVNQAGWNGTSGNGLNAISVVYDSDTGEGSITAGMIVGVYSDSAYTLGRSKGSFGVATLNYMSFALITAVNTGTNTLTLEAGHQIAINDNDYLIVIELAPVVYRDESGTVWRWIGAMWNNASSNLEPNRLHNAASYESNEGANYSTNSTNFTTIDGTNWNHLLIATEVTDILAAQTGTVTANASSAGKFNLLLNGADVAANDGIFSITVSTTPATQVAYSYTMRQQLPGTHRIYAQWCVNANTITMYAGAGSTNLDNHPQFSARLIQ